MAIQTPPGTSGLKETTAVGDPGLQLFEAAVVTAFALIALIWMLGPVSGGHFNPAVTCADVALGGRGSVKGSPTLRPKPSVVSPGH